MLIRIYFQFSIDWYGRENDFFMFTSLCTINRHQVIEKASDEKKLKIFFDFFLTYLY